MRGLARRMRSERGASAVIVAILMVPLIGCLAIAIDVGTLYAERAQLQNGADAAALAIARDCAEDGTCTDPAGLAVTFTNANANDGAANVLAPTFPNDHTVVVSDSTRVAGTDAPALNHPFAALLGITQSTVRATATAEWGGPGAGLVLPLALSYCEFLESGALDHHLVAVRTDTNKTCKKDEAEVPGGFGWIDQIPGKCEAYVDLNAAGELWMGSDPGNSVPGLCDDKLDVVKGQTVLLPIYDASRGSGQNGEYRIYAFAAFKITGWVFSNHRDPDPAAPRCNGNARCVQGYFDKWVSVDSAFELGGEELNGTIVKLTN